MRLRLTSLLTFFILSLLSQNALAVDPSAAASAAAAAVDAAATQVKDDFGEGFTYGVMIWKDAPSDPGASFSLGKAIGRGLFWVVAGILALIVAFALIKKTIKAAFLFPFKLVWWLLFGWWRKKKSK